MSIETTNDRAPNPRYTNGAQESYNLWSGPMGVSKDRRSTGINATFDATKRFEWGAGNGPTEVLLKIKGGAKFDELLYVIDAPDSTIADAWLTESSGATTELTCRKAILNGDFYAEVLISSSDPIENIYFQAVSGLTGTMEVIGEAI